MAINTEPKQSTSNDGCLGNVVWFALLMVSTFLLRYLARELGAAIVAGIVLLGSVAFAGFVAIKSASGMSQRGRLLAVLAGYLSLIIICASAYAVQT